MRSQLNFSGNQMAKSIYFSSDESSVFRLFPEKSLPLVQQMIDQSGIILKLSPPRRRKLGDYRLARNGKPPVITINQNLNPYHFLLTFLHELAHHYTFQKFGQNQRPHGHHWKEEFHGLLKHFIENECFPPEIIQVLSNRRQKFSASANSDIQLKQALRKYDNNISTTPLYLLPSGSVFALPDGRRFIKLQKRRKNFLCRKLDNEQLYIFSPVAEVYPFEGLQL